MTKKIIIKIAIITVGFFACLIAIITMGIDSSSAQSCPQNTVVNGTQATLVGEVTDDGGDPNLEVWFDYGKSQAYTHQTSHFSKYGAGLFCTTVYNLESCTTYHYRAAGKNSVGTSYGEDKTFTTNCNPPSVDLKVNNSDGPLTIPYGQSVNLSWTSTNAASCVASGAWSGSKATYGSESTEALTSSRTYTLTCTGPGGSASDSVTVNVNVPPPSVDLKVNNSDGPLTIPYGQSVNLSWTSTNAASCVASGDWSGSKGSFGAEPFYLNSAKTYVFMITCKDASQTQTTTDTVQVIAQPKPPVVITKPAIITL